MDDVDVDKDEEFARRLQCEFDEENAKATQQEEEDFKFAQRLVAKHEISESEEEEEEEEEKTETDDTMSEHELDRILKEDKMKKRKRNSSMSSSKKKREKEENLSQLHEMSDSNEEEEEEKEKEKKKKMLKNEELEICKFGRECYRKNPEHRKKFRHPDEDEDEEADLKKCKTNPSSCVNSFNFRPNEFHFYLTKVNGIAREFNSNGTIGIEEILSEKMGNLVESAQFNYMTDVEWLMQQYPLSFRQKPLLLVHGEQRASKKALMNEASRYPNITLCQAKLEIVFGTHHTKMMILLYENGLRIVIHTANLIRGDWHQKTQGVWMSPLFPPLNSASLSEGESATKFKRDFVEYLSTYGAAELDAWCEKIKRHDLSAAKVFLIGSTPGRHSGSKMSTFGHLKLRKVLKEFGPDCSQVTSDWNVIGQFSSIGSLGSSSDSWLLKEFAVSLSGTKSPNTTKLPKLQLIFPCVENVRMSLEGYPAGSCLPYSKEVAKKQPWLHSFFHQWKSENRGRSFASPHIKTYSRISPALDSIAWFLITSANLSKAAWGSMEKNGSQLMIRSYELGILFLPEYFNGGKTMKLKSQFNLPFDVPLIPYKSTDEPWIWNAAHQIPDRHGNVWSPH